MSLLFLSMSDLHLGEEDSVLTNLSLGEPVPQPNGPGPCMLALVNYLHAIKGKLNQGKPIPFLILNGDILDLAISSYPISTTYFRLFMTELAKRRLFDRIIYLPGNHDHGLWSLIRDTHFVNSLSQQTESPGMLKIEHVTGLSIPRQSPLLSLLVSNLPMHITPPLLFVANPSFRLQSLQGHDFLFHHGHLLEDIYKFLTLLRDRLMKDVSFDELKQKPLREKIGEIEGENWPWVDFVWSGFTRAGRVGYTMEGIYELLCKPEGMKVLIHRVADALRTELNIPMIPESIEDDIFRMILRKAIEKGGIGSDERADHDQEKSPFSENLKNMTRRFINHYLRQELKDEGLYPATNGTRFIFGHTHKPFWNTLQDDKSGFGAMPVINSGGWVIESDKHLPTHGPGIVFGFNNGDVALEKYELDKKPYSEILPKDTLEDVFGQMDERTQLEEAISRAVKVRWRYFKKRVKKTRKILESLSK